MSHLKGDLSKSHKSERREMGSFLPTLLSLPAPFLSYCRDGLLPRTATAPVDCSFCSHQILGKLFLSSSEGNNGFPFLLVPGLFTIPFSFNLPTPLQIILSFNAFHLKPSKRTIFLVPLKVGCNLITGIFDSEAKLLIISIYGL